MFLCAQRTAGKDSKKKRKALKAKKAQLKAAAAPAADAAARRKQYLKHLTAVSRHEARVQQLMSKVWQTESRRHQPICLKPGCIGPWHWLREVTPFGLVLQALGLPEGVAAPAEETDEDLVALFG